MTVSGEYRGGPRVTCILKEGNITVGTRAYITGGQRETYATLASELRKNELVSVSADTANTYAATDGLPVVTQTANGDTDVVGIIRSEPEWVVMPSASQTTWATMLTGKYYRLATVELLGVTALMRAKLVCADAGAITPGVTEILKFDQSTIVAHTYDVPALNDVASSGMANAFSFHYVAKASSGTADILLAFTGGMGMAAT